MPLQVASDGRRALVAFVLTRGELAVAHDGEPLTQRTGPIVGHIAPVTEALQMVRRRRGRLVLAGSAALVRLLCELLRPQVCIERFERLAGGVGRLLARTVHVVPPGLGRICGFGPVVLTGAARFVTTAPRVGISAPLPL